MSEIAVVVVEVSGDPETLRKLTQDLRIAVANVLSLPPDNVWAEVVPDGAVDLLRLARIPIRSAKAMLKVAANGTSWFRCPECARKVTITAKFVTTWHFKKCAGCGTVWSNTGYFLGGTGPHIGDLDPGSEFELELFTGQADA